MKNVADQVLKVVLRANHRSMWILIELETLHGKISKSFWYFLSLYHIVNLPPMNGDIAKLKDLLKDLSSSEFSMLF